MPDLSNCVRVSKDGHYILATGIYKPRIRCYEVDNLSMKFERCMDAEVVTFEILSDDYTKVTYLLTLKYLKFTIFLIFGWLVEIYFLVLVLFILYEFIPSLKRNTH